MLTRTAGEASTDAASVAPVAKARVLGGGNASARGWDEGMFSLWAAGQCGRQCRILSSIGILLATSPKRGPQRSACWNVSRSVCAAPQERRPSHRYTTV